MAGSRHVLVVHQLQQLRCHAAKLTSVSAGDPCVVASVVHSLERRRLSACVSRSLSVAAAFWRRPRRPRGMLLLRGLCYIGGVCMSAPAAPRRLRGHINSISSSCVSISCC